MENRLLDVLVCPICKGPLAHDRERRELVCRADRVAFPIRDGMPIMIEGQARTWADGEAAADSAAPPR